MHNPPPWYRDLDESVRLLKRFAGHDWEDVRQDVALFLHRKHGSNPVDKSWVCRSIRCRATDAYRKRSRHLRTCRLETDPVDRAAGQLWECIAEMPPHLCQILTMRFLGNYTYREIAEEIGVSPSTVKRTYREAVDLARQLLEGGVEQ